MRKYIHLTVLASSEQDQRNTKFAYKFSIGATRYDSDFHSIVKLSGS